MGSVWPNVSVCFRGWGRARYDRSGRGTAYRLSKIGFSVVLEDILLLGLSRNVEPIRTEEYIACTSTRPSVLLLK